jgi:hypothetical protein
MSILDDVQSYLTKKTAVPYALALTASDAMNKMGTPSPVDEVPAKVSPTQTPLPAINNKTIINPTETAQTPSPNAALEQPKQFGDNYQRQIQGFNTNYLNRLQNQTQTPFQNGASALDYIRALKSQLAIPEPQQHNYKLFGDSRDDLLNEKLNDKGYRLHNEAVAPLMSLAQATVPTELRQPIEKYQTDVQANSNLLSALGSAYKNTDENDLRNPNTQATLLAKKAGVLGAMSQDELNKAHANYYNRQVENEKLGGNQKTPEWIDYTTEQNYLKKHPEESVAFGSNPGSLRSVTIDNAIHPLAWREVIPQSKLNVAHEVMTGLSSKDSKKKKAAMQLGEQAGLFRPKTGLGAL